MGSQTRIMVTLSFASPTLISQLLPVPGTTIPTPSLRVAKKPPGLAQRSLRGDAHSGCGRRLAETRRWKHGQGAPGRPRLVPTHDRSVSASSKNYRYSVNIRVVIGASTRLRAAVGRPHAGQPQRLPLLD